MNKALNRLAAAGVVERRKRFGTAVRPSGGAAGEARMIEVVFSGFTAPFLHPFWSEVLEGLHDVFSAAGCRMILNHIVSEPETHLFDLSRIRLSEAAGRVVVGPGEKRLLDWIAATRRPMICAGDEVSDPDMPGVFFDFTRGIGDATTISESSANAAGSVSSGISRRGSIPACSRNSMRICMQCSATCRWTAH